MSSPLRAVPKETVTRAELLERARLSSRHIERFAYRLVSEAEEPEAVEEARRIMALAVGLRRKLDSWRSHGQ